MGQMANHSVESWRVKLAGGLTAVAKNLNDQLQLEETTHNGVERSKD
jgi:hypothetical protein